MKFLIKDFFSKYDQIRRNLRILSHLLKKSLMENFIFCVRVVKIPHNDCDDDGDDDDDDDDDDELFYEIVNQLKCVKSYSEVATEDIYQRICSHKFSNIYRKTRALESLFHIVEGLRIY